MNEIEDITTILIEIRRVIRQCYEPLCANKLDTWEERDNFLVNHQLAIWVKKKSE